MERDIAYSRHHFTPEYNGRQSELDVATAHKVDCEIKSEQLARNESIGQLSSAPEILRLDLFFKQICTCVCAWLTQRRLCVSVFSNRDLVQSPNI